MMNFQYRLYRCSQCQKDINSIIYGRRGMLAIPAVTKLWWACCKLLWFSGPLSYGVLCHSSYIPQNGVIGLIHEISSYESFSNVIRSSLAQEKQNYPTEWNWYYMAESYYRIQWNEDDNKIPQKHSFHKISATIIQTWIVHDHMEGHLLIIFRWNSPVRQRKICSSVSYHA